MRFVIAALTIAVFFALSGCCSSEPAKTETNAEKSEKAAKEATQELDQELQNK